MKTVIKQADYQEVMALPREKHRNPKRPSFLLRTLIRVLAHKDLKETDFSYTVTDEAKAALETPCLILMNHSSFIDLEIVSKIMYPKPYNIVCTSDGFIGKEKLMRSIGCIPTKKFVSDFTLIKDMKFALEKLKCSVLMYPEASYSFDGCTTPLPEHLCGLFRLLKCPVVMVKTDGAFLRDPLYNGLQKRKVKVSADVSLLCSPEEESNLSLIHERLTKAFTYNGFAWQKKHHVKITEPFRADGLERILYKCTECGAENTMVGKGTELHCTACHKSFELDPYGSLVANNGEAKFSQIPAWYAWERECVKKELAEGTYRMEEDVTIGVMVNYDAIYTVGEGKLIHTKDGFTLTGCDGKLHYVQKPQASYGLYSDYFWYEIGDMICIGNNDVLYYCFPKNKCAVAKARMAAEELFRITSAELHKEAAAES